jgi:hypothetical protein
MLRPHDAICGAGWGLKVTAKWHVAGAAKSVKPRALVDGFFSCGIVCGAKPGHNTIHTCPSITSPHVALSSQLRDKRAVFRELRGTFETVRHPRRAG